MKLTPRHLALACTVLAALRVASRADDWPTYRHDNARSGVTAEKLTPPLAPCWTFQPRHAPKQAWGDPNPRPVGGWYGSVEGRRVHFDDTYHVAVAGGAVFFASSSDGTVTALDAATGQVRWSVFTGGPARLAPAVSKGKVYVGSDDGVAYCLQAADGKEVWRFRAAPSDRRVLGSGRMISLWPIRTGVTVDDGVAYVGSGVFPAEGVYMYALGAEDGKLLWCNDTGGAQPQSRVSPQGYLLASKTTLFAPMGRVSPAAFDRKDGRLLHLAYVSHDIGGTAAQLVGDSLVTGTEQLVAYSQGKPTARSAWFRGRRVAFTPDVAYLATDRELLALDRTTYPKVSVRYKSALDRRERINQPLSSARNNIRKAEGAIKQDEELLKALDQESPDHAQAAKQLQADTKALANAKTALAKLEDQLKAIKADAETAEADFAATTLWRVPSTCAEELILAGGILFAGGDARVAAIDATDGKTLWTAAVEGKANGLAVAEGRLFVSTDTGAICCFGPADSQPLGTVRQATTDAPFPRDELTPVIEAAADQILKTAAVRRGYCLVLGSGTGRLAYELARKTELLIYGVEPDPAKVDAARKALDAAGLYGTRIWIEQGSLDGRIAGNPQPYSDYFANLIVSESALVSGQLPGKASEALRMLKPIGGTLCIGLGAKGSAEALRSWLAPIGGGEVTEEEGVWLKLVRGPLPGAGSWTHEYANPANTTCGDDELVKCPLGVLWFGDPGPGDMVERHPRAAAPLSINGRLFIQGFNVLMAYDAYNGLKLWERKIQGALRVGVSNDASNLVAGSEDLFAIVGAECLRIDAATGETKATYKLPPAADGKPRRWGYVATTGDLVFGTTTTTGRTADCLFAIDYASGALRWRHDGKAIQQSAISIGDGHVFLVEAPPEAKPKPADRVVVVLDAATGKKVWEKAYDLTGAAGGSYFCSLASIYSKGVLVLFGVYSDGHYWQQFFAGQFGTRRVVALSATDGSVLWDKKIGYRVRPLVVGDTFHAEPWAFDLRTGEQKTRVNPVTGQEEPWQFARPGHHCGCPAAAPHALFFRSFCFGYYDLDGDYGTMHFGSQRPGCWINFIPANGLLLMPEASSGCMCPFPNMCTVVFQPRAENRAWAYYSATGPLTPVQRLGINLGASGDRKDASGTLWLGYPRPGGSLVLRWKADVSLLSGGSYFETDPERVKIEGTDAPWVFRSGVRGFRQCTIPLVESGEGAARYTVRLAFAEPDQDAPRKRVFDIKLQGKVALKGFDLPREAGGRNRALVKEFKGIEVQDKLKVELVSRLRKPAPQETPVLQGIEVIREAVLYAGLTVPSFLLNDETPEQEGVVRLANYKDEAFDGTLRIEAPKGFAVTPGETSVKLATGQRAAVAVKAAVAGKPSRAKHAVTISLLRADGAVETKGEAVLEYLAERGRIALKAVEDAHVDHGTPTSNHGTAKSLLVDGGDAEMGDESHQVTYLKFRLSVPGEPLSAVLRIYNAGNPTGDGGNVCLVTEPWAERKITYDARPKPGRVLARIGPVSENQVVEVPLKLSLAGLAELSLVIDPLNCDGVDYISREGGKPAELIVEYSK